jgi:protein SCO1/2
VSVDPDRDTVEILKSYVEFFSKDLIGVTGSTEQLEKLASQLAVGFEIQPKFDTNYSVDHSNTILLISPIGEFQAVFTAPHTVNRLVADMRAISKWYLDLN